MLGLGGFSLLGRWQESAVRGRSCSASMPQLSGPFLPKAGTGSSCGEINPLLTPSFTNVQESIHMGQSLWVLWGTPSCPFTLDLAWSSKVKFRGGKST